MGCTSPGQCSMLLIQLAIYGLSNGAVIALNALGLTLIYSVVRTVHLAYGDLFAFTTTIITTIIAQLGLQAGGPLFATAGGLALAFVAAIVAGALMSLALERLIFRPFRNRSQLAPLVAGLGLSFVLFQGALLWRTIADVGLGNPEHHSDVDNLANVSHAAIPELLPRTSLLAGSGVRLMVMPKDVLVVVAALVLALTLWWVLMRTRTGRMLRAYAQDPEGAALCGVDQAAVIRITFALGGALAGAAAFCFVLAYGRAFGQHGAQSGLTAFTAAVLGGVGNPLGALASGLVLGMLGSFSDYLFPAQWTPVLVLGVLVTLLLLRPHGLLGSTTGDAAPPEVLLRPLRKQGGRWFLPALAAAGAAYLALDMLLGWHTSAQAANMLILALLALGLNLILGYTGMLDLGFAACFAIGGVVAALLMGGTGTPHPQEFVVLLLASGAAAMLFGLLNGTLTVRLRGDALAIVSLAFGQIVPRTLVNLQDITGGVGGIAALPPPSLAGFSITAMPARFVLAGVLVLVAAGGCVRLAQSRLGRAWAALRDDSDVAASVGVPVQRLRPLAFGLGAGLAGVAAALSAVVFGYVAPTQGELQLSIVVLSMVVIGGLGSVPGVVAGALAVAWYDSILYPAISGWWAEQSLQVFWMRAIDLRSVSYLAFGLMLYLVVRVRAAPRGQQV